jgi:toxin-antitoxin system PIN domain toxin
MKKATDLLLLDVNVLVALAWPNHQFHAIAKRRFGGTAEHWATCAITQLGFIRVSSTPAVVNPATTPGEAARLLAAMTADSLHVYLGTLPSPLRSAGTKFDRILGSRQVTDAYLVSLAGAHNATFVTFDHRLGFFAPSESKVETLGL